MTDIKIAHLSDLHLGYKSTRLTTSQGINLREADGYLAFATAITDIIAESVDAVVVSGDIFHIPTPEIRAILFAQNQFRRFWQAGIPVYMLAGNHDTNDVKSDIAASRLLHDPARKIFSHVEPYITHEIADGVTLHMVSHHMYSEQAETMKAIKPVDGINIFATHGSCIDPLLKEKLHTEQSPREIVIPDFLFEDYDWDYAFLGHIHERGWVGSRDGKSDTAKKKVYYNGSLVRRGFSDKECKLGRGWTLWTVGSDGAFTPRHNVVAQRPQQDFPIIDAKNKTAKEISDLIVKNLRTSQVNGQDFDPKIAPILRQRILNLQPAVHSALDSNAINQNSQHAMLWSIKPISKEEVLKKEASVGGLHVFDGTDVVKIYDEWIKSSGALAKTEEELKETAKDQARKFVEAGQEVTLND